MIVRIDVRKQSGNVLLGAMVAVMMAGTVGAAMVAMYESYVKNARFVFVKSAMTSVDNKIRYLAMQPYAYNCGKESSGDQFGGVQSCELNKAYFASVMRVALPGTCAKDPNCGFVLEFDPEQKDPALKRGFQVQDRGGVQTGVFLYNLRYEGSDFSLRPAGQNLDAAQHELGMVIPREVLQSEDFDCASANGGTTPVFQGFGPDGRPICVGFQTCEPGKYATSVNFKTQKVNCVPFDKSRMTIACRAQGQYKISNISWHDGMVDTGGGACTELPTPPPPGAAPTNPCGPGGCATTPPPRNGVCNDVTWNSATGAAYHSFADCGLNCVRKNIALPDSVQVPPGCTLTGYTLSWGFYANISTGLTPHCQTTTPPMDIAVGDYSRKTFGFGGICGPARNGKTSCTYTQMDGPRSFFLGDVTYGYSSGATGCLEDVVVVLHSRPSS